MDSHACVAGPVPGRSWPAGLRQLRRLAELSIIANTATAFPSVELLSCVRQAQQLTMAFG